MPEPPILVLRLRSLREAGSAVTPTTILTALPNHPCPAVCDSRPTSSSNISSVRRYFRLRLEPVLPPPIRGVPPMWVQERCA